MTEIRRYHASELRHLESALGYEAAATGKGTCFLRAAALALDWRDALVTFGTIRAATEEEQRTIPGASTVPFIHAWVEIEPDTVYAPTTYERAGGALLPFLKSDYYERNGVYDVCRLPRDKFEFIARRWGLSAAFRHRATRVGAGRLVDEMLQAAGVKYTLSDCRSVLPAK